MGGGIANAGGVYSAARPIVFTISAAMDAEITTKAKTSRVLRSRETNSGIPGLRAGRGLSTAPRLFHTRKSCSDIL